MNELRAGDGWRQASEVRYAATAAAVVSVQQEALPKFHTLLLPSCSQDCSRYLAPRGIQSTAGGSASVRRHVSRKQMHESSCDSGHHKAIRWEFTIKYEICHFTVYYHSRLHSRGCHLFFSLEDGTFQRV